MTILVPLLILISLGLAAFIFLHLRKKKKNVQNSYKILFNKIDSIPELNDQLIEIICDWLIDFWSITMSWNREDVKKSIQYSEIIYLDQSSMEISWYNEKGEEVKEVIYGGVTWPDARLTKILVKPQEGSWQTPLQRTIALTKHELSHTLVANMDAKYYTNEASHELFDKVQLDQQAIKFNRE